MTLEIMHTLQIAIPKFDSRLWGFIEDYFMKVTCCSHSRNLRVQKEENVECALQLSHIVNLWKKPDTIAVGDVMVNTCYLNFP